MLRCARSRKWEVDRLNAQIASAEAMVVIEPNAVIIFPRDTTEEDLFRVGLGLATDQTRHPRPA
jgi:hypothetical protein